MQPGNTITIDGRSVGFEPGDTLLKVARGIGLDIPTLCYLEKCGPLNTCQVCLVKADGKLVPSCGIKARTGMVIESETEEVHEARRTALELLFSDHVGDCLAPCQRLCPLGLNVPLLLRTVQEGRQEEASTLIRSSLPLAGVLGHLCHHPCEQGCRRGHFDDPAAIREIERHVALSEMSSAGSTPVSAPAAAAFKVAVVGAGPSGLGAAWHLARQGCAVALYDRNSKPGGALRETPGTDMPASVLEHEESLLRRMGVSFHYGQSLGKDLTVSDLARTFDAVLLACGSQTPEELAAIGLPSAGAFLKVDANTSGTSVMNVFATGAMVRQTRQVVRVLSEAKTAADSVLRFLKGENTNARNTRVFSSVMGRLFPGELEKFLLSASPSAKASPCDRCAGFNRKEAVDQSSRCLHCDCRASGNCALQHYAQVYSVDAARFRSERKSFDQQLQPGGVIFEPGKCIVCGICVKLTEMAAEPLGLTFIGRGFDVKLAAPLNRTIEEGLTKTAEECVRHCPTGALSFLKD